MTNQSLLDKDDLLPELLEPASMGKRFLNMILDVIFYYIIIVALGAGAVFLMTISESFTNTTADDGSTGGISGVLNSIILVLTYGSYLIYFIFFEAFTGKTIGKMITKTKVVSRKTGKKPPFWNIVGRTFARLIPFDGFSFLTENPIGWHDSLSGTMVVNDIPFYDTKKYDEESF